jgi:putative ABC transport system permease protein
MSWLSRLRNVLRSNRHSDELDREMAFHLAERADDLEGAGLAADAARFEARRRFGNYGRLKERTRERDLLVWADTLRADVRYALRGLRAAPAFALVAILSLALGIGANTAIFTLIDAVMLRSLPVSHPEQLVFVTHNDANTLLTNPIWEQIRDRQDMFARVFAYGNTTFDLSRGGEARPTQASYVSGGFFLGLGVRPVIGRLLSPADDWRGCPSVAVVSHSFWQNELQGTREVVGRSIWLEGHPFEVAGVADPAFFGVTVGQHTNVYIPLCSEAVIHGRSSWLDARSTWNLHVMGRPKPELTIEQVRARLAALAPSIAAATVPANHPVASTERYLKATLGIRVAPNGVSSVRQDYHGALLVLMAVVGVVLLIACANVANLLLARAATRQREMAVRLALGAGRGRLLRQLLTESVLLSSLAAALGVLFAVWGTRTLVAMMSTTEETVSLDLALDLRVLGFTIGVTVVTGILFGLVPALRSGRVDPQAAMKSHARGVAEGHSRFTVGKALVVAQVALSLVLIAGAGLLLGSWRRLSAVDPGFQPSGVLIARAETGRTRIDPAHRATVFGIMLETVRSTPGVQAASAADITPISGSEWNDVIQVTGFTPKTPNDALFWQYVVTDGYFGTMGTPVITGRDFDARDVLGSPRVAIVTETFARRFFGTTAVVGRQYRVEEGKDFGPPIAIIGVVRDSKYGSLREEARPIAFNPLTQNKAPDSEISFEIRSRGRPSAMIATLTSRLTEVDPGVRLQFITLDRQLDESLRLPRTLATLSGLFGALALLLATIGLYGIMSYSVARRRNEIGVRIALGAVQSRVIRMVLGEVGRMVIAGVAAGVALSFAVTGVVSKFLYGVEPNDPMTLTLSAVGLVAVAIGAAFLPAWRAARMDPVTALRED